MSRLFGALCSLSLCAGCLVVPEGAAPAVSVDASVASQFNFRGMTNVDAWVAQTEAIIDLPTKVEQGTLSVRAWANWDLENDAGDAWFPGGHAGEPSQIDTQVSYTETYLGYDFTSGIVSYALQNGDDFARAPDGERGETKELFFVVQRPTVWELVPALRVHYDIDEVEGWYWNASVSRGFPVREDMVVGSRVSLGYADADQADWLYGIDQGGLADLQLHGGLEYFLDQNTTLRLGLNFSTILEDDVRDWLEDDIDIDADAFWAALGVTWAY